MENVLQPMILDVIVDGPRGTTTPGVVNESGFFVRSEQNHPNSTIDVRSRLAGLEEHGVPNQARSEPLAPPPHLPDAPSPLPPTITKAHPLLHYSALEILGLGGSGYVYKCPGDLAYKQHATQREVDLMTAAGDCAVTPLSRVLREVDGVLRPEGLVMELATPFNFKSVSPTDRAAVKDEMVALVARLHSSEFGIVHGDIKPANFLRCRDGRLRLCDFDSGRFIADEEVEGWEGLVSERYLAPSRGYPEYGPPTVLDDGYALAISVWELYTGKDALVEEDMEEGLKDGRTVDLDELEDADVRAFVREWLLKGGAKV